MGGTWPVLISGKPLVLLTLPDQVSSDSDRNQIALKQISVVYPTVSLRLITYLCASAIRTHFARLDRVGGTSLGTYLARAYPARMAFLILCLGLISVLQTASDHA